MFTVTKYEHASIVLYLEERNFVLTNKDVLQGVSTESKNVLVELGDKGWELVSVVPYSRSWGRTEALLAFFKRCKE